VEEATAAACCSGSGTGWGRDGYEGRRGTGGSGGEDDERGGSRSRSYSWASTSADAGGEGWEGSAAGTSWWDTLLHGRGVALVTVGAAEVKTGAEEIVGVDALGRSGASAGLPVRAATARNTDGAWITAVLFTTAGAKTATAVATCGVARIAGVVLVKVRGEETEGEGEPKAAARDRATRNDALVNLAWGGGEGDVGNDEEGGEERELGHDERGRCWR
jgi:hypothetical protein